MSDTPKKGNLKGPEDGPIKDHPDQPSKAEKEEEIDMPGWTLDQVRKVFMRPLTSTHVINRHNPHYESWRWVVLQEDGAHPIGKLHRGSSCWNDDSQPDGLDRWNTLRLQGL